MDCKLFGWAKNKDGKIVCVSDVPKGISCDCLCPHCGAPLLARKGKVRKHHFAHTKGMECQHGYEASVHLLAKEVFQETKTLCLPRFALRHEYKGGADRVLVHNSRKNNNRDCEVNDQELAELMHSMSFGSVCYADEYQRPPVTFDEVLIEQFRGDVKPDAIAVVKGYELFVEFLFSHAVDNEKYKKIVESKVACVEVDLSNIKLKNDRDYDFSAMAKYLTDKSNIRWIYYPEAIGKIHKILKREMIREKEENKKRENYIKSQSLDYTKPNAATHKRQNNWHIESRRAPYSKKDSEFMYGQNCCDIQNRVETGGDEVCAYVKEMREIKQRGGYPWQDMLEGKREQCRRCPDHKTDCYDRVFCSRYENKV